MHGCGISASGAQVMLKLRSSNSDKVTLKLHSTVVKVPLSNFKVKVTLLHGTVIPFHMYCTYMTYVYTYIHTYIHTYTYA